MRQINVRAVLVEVEATGKDAREVEAADEEEVITRDRRGSRKL